MDLNSYFRRFWGTVFSDLSVNYYSLSLFRIIAYSCFLFEILSLYPFNEFSIQNIYARSVLLPILLVSCILTLIGFKTRIFSIVFYICFQIFYSLPYDRYEPDLVIVLFSFFQCFTPKPRVWSVDSYQKKCADPYEEIPFGLVICMLIIEVGVYYQAAMVKVGAISWTSGTAVWLANYIPYASEFRLPDFFQILFVSKLLSWAVIAYELFFILIIIKPFRRLFVLFGFFLHLGIAITTPLTLFGLMMIAPLMLFTKIGSVKRRINESRVSFYKVSIFSYALLLFIGSFYMIKYKKYDLVVNRIMGIHKNGYYGDGAFRTSGPFYRIDLVKDQVRSFLPSFDAEGYPTVKNRYWKIWGFFIRNGCINPIQKFIRRYEKDCRGNCSIELFSKDMSLQNFEFNKNLVNEMHSKPWIYLGRFNNESDANFVWLPSDDLSSLSVIGKYLENCSE